MLCEPPLPAGVADEEKPELLRQLETLRLALPDEDGFVESPLIPEQMLPGSIIYYTDAGRYVIIDGGISLDTQEKLDAYLAERKTYAQDAMERGIHVAPLDRSEAGGCVLYAMDGGISHEYGAGEVADMSFAWYFRDESCEALAAGFRTASPAVYYRLEGEEWQVCRVMDWSGFSEEELEQMEIRSVVVNEGSITVTAFCGEEVVRSVVPEQP